jgi:hypothetical protein
VEREPSAHRTARRGYLILPIARMNRSMKVTLPCLLLASGLCASANPQPERPTVASIPEIFAVSSIAYRDFVKQLKDWEQKWLAGGRSESETQRYMSDVRNYEITLFAHGDTVHVTFTLRPIHGTEFFGGATRYVLDRKTGAILEHKGEK